MQAQLLFRSAILLVLGLLTGILVSAAMTGKIPAEEHAMLASHLNALLGAFWMGLVALSEPHLHLKDSQKAALWTTVTVSNYANWLITLIKAFLRVKGVDFVGEPTNDVVFGLLTMGVVLPGFAAAGLWAYGLKPRNA